MLKTVTSLAGNYLVIFDMKVVFYIMVNGRPHTVLNREFRPNDTDFSLFFFRLRGWCVANYVQPNEDYYVDFEFSVIGEDDSPDRMYFYDHDRRDLRRHV